MIWTVCKMIFTNKQKLLEFIQSHIADDMVDIKLELYLPILENKKEEVKSDCGCSPKTLTEVYLPFLNDSPKVKSSFNENDDNILYVDNAEYTKDFCGTGKLQFLNRELLINMCESENKLTINLNIKINEQLHYNVPFTVKLKEDTDTVVKLSNKYKQ